MNIQKTTVVQSPPAGLINEIQYYMAFSALKRCLNTEKIDPNTFKQMNSALAKKYAVRAYFV